MKRQKGRRPVLSDSCSFATKVISNASRSIHLISSTSPRVLNVIIVPPSSVPREPFPLHAQLWPSPRPFGPPPSWSRDIILSRLPVPTHQRQLYDFHNLNTMPDPESVTIDSHYSLSLLIMSSTWCFNVQHVLNVSQRVCLSNMRIIYISINWSQWQWINQKGNSLNVLRVNILLKCRCSLNEKCMMMVSRGMDLICIHILRIIDQNP